MWALANVRHITIEKTALNLHDFRAPIILLINATKRLHNSRIGNHA